MWGPDHWLVWTSLPRGGVTSPRGARRGAEGAGDGADRACPPANERRIGTGVGRDGMKAGRVVMAGPIGGVDGKERPPDDGRPA